MCTKDFRSTKAITLIALVVSIVVLLILAGVSIVTLTGDNGLLSQVQNAKEKTNVAEFKEAVQLAYMTAYSKSAENGTYTVGMAEMIGDLLIDHPEYDEIITLDAEEGVVSIVAKKEEKIFNNTDSPVVVAKQGEETITVVPTTTTGTGGRAYVELSGKNYEILISGDKVILEEITGEIPEITNDVTVERDTNLTNANITVTKGNNLNITIEAGTTAVEGELTISYGGKSTVVKVQVKETYTVNLYANSTATTANSITVVQGEKASEAAGYAEPAAPTEEEIFDTWVLKTAVGTGVGEKVGDEATSYLNNVTRNLDVYATYKEKPEFGEADAALKEHFGKTVITKGATDTEVAVGTATAGWQLFYADTNKIFLIYAHYYPNVELQNKTSPIANGNGNYTVKSTSNRDTLITYLKTANNWTNVSSAFNTKFSVTGITAKGAPTPDMWMASYNARYGTKLGAKNFKTTGQTYYEVDSSTGEMKTTSGTTSATGYLYTRDTTTNPIKWEIGLPFQYMNQQLGYSKNMYYPETSGYDSKHCYMYWLTRFII